MIVLDEIPGPTSPDVIAVVCKDDASLAVLTEADLAVLHRVPLTAVGHEVTVDHARRRAYVPLFGTGAVGQPGASGDGIDVVDLSAGEVVETIRLPEGARPHDVAWGDSQILHVTAEGLSAVLSVDTRTGLLLETWSTGHPQSHMLATSPRGRRLYTANVHPGSLTEIDLASRRTRTTPLAPTVNRVSVSADGAHAYVADQEQPRLAVIDLMRMRVEAWLPLPGIAFGTTPSKDGRHIVLALRDDRLLAVLDLKTLGVTLSPRLPSGPQRVVLASGERMAYTTCSPADAVVAVELASMSVVRVEEVGPNPDGIALSRTGRSDAGLPGPCPERGISVRLRARPSAKPRRVGEP